MHACTHVHRLRTENIYTFPSHGAIAYLIKPQLEIEITIVAACKVTIKSGVTRRWESTPFFNCCAV